MNIAEEDKFEIDLLGTFSHDEVHAIGDTVCKQQLKTQSSVTSIYGCNMRGKHLELQEQDIEAEDIYGKQVVIKEGMKFLNIRGYDIGSLVLANININPAPREYKKRNGDSFEVIDRDYFKSNVLDGICIVIDCKVKHLTITNCANMIICIKDRIRTSIEISNSEHLKLSVDSFSMYRVITSKYINLRGLVSKHGLFDIRNSIYCKWYNIDIPCNEYISCRYKHVNKTLVPVPVDEDVFSIHGSHSLPSTHINWWFK